MKNEHTLSPSSQMILQQYDQYAAVWKVMKKVVTEEISKIVANSGVTVTAVDSRIKDRKSLHGKLELKGYKYFSISDLTDIVGARITTFYTDDVDKVAALIAKVFDVDWKNSVDKRKMHELNSFGYMSLHYICRIPESLFKDESLPEVNTFRFEVQMRTALQHVWATIDHDIGYKTGIEIPVEHLRNLRRLAGMLELADEEFSRIRKEIADYRYKVEGLVKDGNFDDVALDADTFRRYLETQPFRALEEKIAAVNQAEIYHSSLMPFLKVLLKMGLKTLGDVERLRKNYSDAAYKLSLSEIADTDLNIISSTLALQNICIAYLYLQGSGVPGIQMFFDEYRGVSDRNRPEAESLMDRLKNINFDI